VRIRVTGAEIKRFSTRGHVAIFVM